MQSIPLFQLAVSRAACFIIVMFLTIQVHGDESDIIVTVLNPAGFMAPGANEDIVLEIFNPIGSGVTILSASGTGYSPPRQRTELRDHLNNLTSFRRIDYSGQSEACETSGVCVLEGQYPIAPGESVRQVYFQAQVPLDEIVSRELRWSKARLSIRTDSRQKQYSYYLDTDILRVVTSDGTGSPDYFDSVTLKHGYGGIVQASLSASFDYPLQVLAGENFTIDVALTNYGSEALIVMPGWPLAFQDVAEGIADGSSYRFIGCEQQCQKSSTSGPHLEPGDTMLLEVGSFVYQNEYLINSELSLGELSLRVFDHLQRFDQIIADHAPLNISIISPSGIESVNTAMQVPNTLPLEAYGLGDIANTMLVLDPNTNMEWMPLTAAERFSIAEIESALESGGQLEGFRFAFADEVESLILNHAHSEGAQLQLETLYSFLEFDANESIATLIRLMGNIPSVNSGLRTIGIVADPAPNSGTGRALYVSIALSARDSRAFITSADGIKKDVISLDYGIYEYVGYWLVREL